MQRADHDIAAMAPPPAGEVRVFVALLDIPEDALGRARRLLAPEERARADAFLRPRDRAHFTAARAWLRRMLGAHLGLDPASLAFAYGPHGKPRLPAAAGALDFNLSHSDGVALLALSPGFELGADIEAVRPVEEKVAERFFSAAEVRALAALPARERTSAFFRCWCRKEAYLKALGSGLATPLDAFTVSLGPDEPARLLRVEGEPEAPAIWQLAHLDPAPGFAGAVAAPSRGWRLRL
jgi:4'-phosphopantetheinyl transferase